MITQAPGSGGVDPNTKQHGTGKGAAPGPQIGVNIEHMENRGAPDDGQKVAQHINRGVSSYGSGRWAGELMQVHQVAGQRDWRT